MYKTRSKNIQKGDGIYREKLSDAAERVLARKNERINTISKLRPGNGIDGVVTMIRPDGAFVDLGGVTGFIHISEITDKRIGHPSDMLRINEHYFFRILSVGLNKKGNISAKLSLRSHV